MRIALVSIGIAAALVASGSATVEQAQSAGMALLAATALVVLLEVVNVVGTWTWLVDPDTRIQGEAAIGVGAASLVTAICGVISYGLIGLVAPVGVLFTVHLVGRLTHRKKPVEQPVDQSTAVDEPVDDAWQQYVGQAMVEPMPEPIDPPTEPIDSELLSKITIEDEPHVAVSMAAAGGKTVAEPRACRRPELCDADDHGHAPTAPEPTVPAEERARQLIAVATERGERLSESKLHKALAGEGYSVTKYQCKKFLGYKTRPAAELEAVS